MVIETNDLNNGKSSNVSYSGEKQKKFSLIAGDNIYFETQQTDDSATCIIKAENDDTHWVSKNIISSSEKDSAIKAEKNRKWQCKNKSH